MAILVPSQQVKNLKRSNKRERGVLQNEIQKFGAGFNSIGFGAHL